MQTSLDFHAQANCFRFQAYTIEEGQSRDLMMQLSQTWETLAQAWDSLPPPYVGALEP